jgi:arylsulfatase A-like enzyme
MSHDSRERRPPTSNATRDLRECDVSSPHMRWFLPVLFVIVALFAFTAGALTPAMAAAMARPNVLLIMADDLGFSDIGPYGGEIRTPNLDRLAAEGMRFTQFYNCAVCWNSRSALLSGLHPRPGRLESNMTTIGDVMRSVGYTTATVGKWHTSAGPTNHPNARGFDHFYGFIGGEVNYFRPSRRNWDAEDAVPFQRNAQRFTLADFPAEYYTTNGFSEETAVLIRKSAETNRPFFIHLAYNAPHSPLHALPEDIARYRGKYRDGYFRLREKRFQRQLEMGLFERATTKLSPADGHSGAFRQDFDIPDWDKLDPVSRRREEERMEVYAAIVDRLDQGIGRVMRALEETGLDKNTVIFFMSDNGGASEPTSRQSPVPLGTIPVGQGRGNEKIGTGWGWAQNTPFRRYKVWPYEGGICTPMIVRWPGVVQPGAIVTDPNHLVDFMPTLMEMSGGKYPTKIKDRAVPPMEGRSLMPILRGERAAPRTQMLCWEFWGGRAVRDNQWKLVWGGGTKRWELYDLSTDRTEMNDLTARHPERVAKMAAAWNEWAQRVAPKGFPPPPQSRE